MQAILELVLRYLNGIWIYRWIGLAVAWVVCSIGWLVVLSLPNVYEAKARFYVDASSRLREVVQSLGMEPDVSSRVFLVRQAMLGRPQLESVARETDLDLYVTNAEEQEALINRLRDNISIETGRLKEAQNLFAIKYSATSRETALNVVSTLLNNFLNDVLAQKDTDTERTENFLQEQLQYYRRLLENTEQKLETFKRDHAGFVVGDRGSYFERMQEQSRLVEDLQSKYQVEQRKREELRRQLGQVNPYAPVTDGQVNSVPIPGSETSARLSELERQKRELLLRVTEKHPDVVAINEQISQLQRRLKQELAQQSNTSIDGARSATNPVYIEIQIALSNSNLRLTELTGEVQQAQSELTKLRNEVDRAPELERQYIELTRDYDNYRNLYAEVLEKAERERIGRVGDEKDIISFNIIDPPTAAIDPVAPPRGLLLFAVLIVGLGAAAAVALFLWQLKPTYGNEREMYEELDMPILGTISMDIRHIGHSRKARVLQFAAAASVLLVAFVLVILVQEQAMNLVQTLLGDHA